LIYLTQVGENKHDQVRIPKITTLSP